MSLKVGQIIDMYIPEIDEVIKLDFFDYLRGVVASEMPANYSFSALQAQAVVARTYYMNKQKDGHENNCNICSSSSHCQVYKPKDEIFRLWKVMKGWSDEEINNNWNKVNSAVISTDGIVITYNGQFINAFFHASSPICTESSSEIWGKQYIPYLVSVPNVEKEDYINRTSTVEIEKTYFKDKIRQNLNGNFELGDGFLKVNSNTQSGRVNDVVINGFVISAEKMRQLFGLKSTLFTIENYDDKYVFNVIGYGHGVGMSQVGADYLGENGKTYEEIIKYYYKGVELMKI